MEKLLLLIFTFIFLFAIQETYSQGSSTAVMQVSVRVVQGTSIETEQPDFITIENTNRVNIGRLNLKGIDMANTLFSISDNIDIEDREGKNGIMNVSNEQVTNRGEKVYKLFGSTNQILQNGMYRGKLTATIEHL